MPVIPLRSEPTPRDMQFFVFFRTVVAQAGHYLAAENIELIMSDFAAGEPPESTVRYLLAQPHG